jgi:CspA family cold shock protein
MSSSLNVSSSAQRNTGRVKWFNGKAGYGFITATTGEQVGTDVFVHHSGLVVANQQYRYLVQGEYVEFQMSMVEGGTHRFQALDVSGIGRGMLMCETRRLMRDYQLSGDQDSQCAVAPNEGVFSTKRTRQSSTRGSGPREVIDLTTHIASDSSVVTANTDAQPVPKRARNKNASVAAK